jgi:hypothetical protein
MGGGVVGKNNFCPLFFLENKLFLVKKHIKSLTKKTIICKKNPNVHMDLIEKK